MRSRAGEDGESVEGEEGGVDGGELGRRADPEEVDVSLETGEVWLVLLDFAGREEVLVRCLLQRGLVGLADGQFLRGSLVVGVDVIVLDIDFGLCQRGPGSSCVSD